MPAMKPRKAEKSRAPATTGDASSAPATASKGGKLPTVSGTGPGEWNDALVAGVVQVCAGSDPGTEPAHTCGDIGPRSRLRAVWEPCGARCIIVGPLLEDLHP